jgi:hypothetical protein
LDEDIVEDDVDWEDDREDARSSTDLACSSQELEIDLNQEEKSEKKCRISQNST